MQQLKLPAVQPWQPPEPTDQLDIAVLAALRDGRVHDRTDVAHRVSASVRHVRGAVSNLRTMGWPICFGPNGGYRLSWDDEDLETLLRKYRRQALTELRVVNRLKRIIRDKAGLPMAS